MTRRVKIQKYSDRFVNENNTINNKISDQNSNFLPMPIEIWPFEGKLIFVILSFWCIFGLFILGSASWWVANKEIGDWAFFLKRQMAWYIPGITIFLFVLNTNIRDLLKISKPIFYILLFLIGSTIFFGSTINGSTRWLILGPLKMQPSELIKPFCILESANLFAHWNLVKDEKKIISLVTFGLLILLIMKQPNLSTAGLIGIMFWIIALCGGVKINSLITVATAGAISAYLSVMNNQYQMLRIKSFINPWSDPEGNGYQLIQSLLAIGSGGILGKGFGLSMQKLQY